MTVWTGSFWKAAAERAIKTAAQTAIVVIGAEAFNVLSVDWLEVGAMSAGGAVLSVLTSLASSHVGGPGPSAVDAEKLNGA